MFEVVSNSCRWLSAIFLPSEWRWQSSADEGCCLACSHYSRRTVAWVSAAETMLSQQTHAQSCVVTKCQFDLSQVLSCCLTLSCQTHASCKCPYMLTQTHAYITGQGHWLRMCLKSDDLIELLLPPLLSPLEDTGKTPILSQECMAKRSGFRATCLRGNHRHHDNLQVSVYGASL